MKNIIAFCTIGVLLYSCSDKFGNKEIKIDNRYSLTIPGFLTETNELNDEASLQFMNAAREFYVLVIDENKEEFHEAIQENFLGDLYGSDLDGYANVLIDNFNNSADVQEQSEIKKTKINGMTARLVTFKAKFDGIDVYCNMAYVEGKENYYQIFCWTLLSNEKKYKTEIDAIPLTFKEL